ncbi:hypothetical protein ALC62_08666 [Cyphomyrmex costatus]|uniref:Uncharacterized protein n=1 Tax=Cyphomyrmex costatus TaxID=456900 RepID=A0A195CIJ0_9HYME|nr:hypothetical protein ALC62_08666 [Cyphomyrmex costatus]
MKVGSSMNRPISESRTELLLCGAAASSADCVSTVSNLLESSSCDSDFSERRFIRSIRVSTPTSCSPTMLGDDGGDVLPSPLGIFLGLVSLSLAGVTLSNSSLIPQENTKDDNEWKWANRTIAWTTSAKDQLSSPLLPRNRSQALEPRGVTALKKKLSLLQVYKVATLVPTRSLKLH